MNIRRLTSCDEVLRHMEEHRPALVDEAVLRTGAPIAKDFAELAERTAPWDIRIEPSYARRLLGAAGDFLRTHDAEALERFDADAGETLPLDDYLTRMHESPESTPPAVELRPSSALLETLGSRGPLLERLGLDFEPGQAKAADHAALVYAYLAAARQASDLHFDRDGRHVFNLTVIGRKRYLLFPPRSGPRLDPIMYFGGVRLRDLSDDERAGFLRYAGGVELVVDVGEAVYIPPFFWHHVDYLEPSFSVGVRGVSPPPRLGAVLDEIPANHLLQLVASEILRAPEEPIRRRCLERVEGVVAEPWRTAPRAYDRIRTTLRSCLDDLGIDVRADRYVDSVDFGAPLFRRFLEPKVDASAGPRHRLDDAVRITSHDERHARVEGSDGRVFPIPLNLVAPLLSFAKGRTVDEVAGDHPDVDSNRLNTIVERLTAAGLLHTL
ncbi:MAG: cupin-like domain-containing protein [Deltaproteobacteria bacterium]